MEVTLQLRQLNEIEMLLSTNNEAEVKLAELTIWNCTTLVSFLLRLLAIKSFQCKLNHVGIACWYLSGHSHKAEFMWCGKN